LKLAEQIKALENVLTSFGNAKTLMNPNASRHGRYLELYFNEQGRISAAKVLTFGQPKLQCPFKPKQTFMFVALNIMQCRLVSFPHSF
jgi:hypothetical protein